MSQQRNPYVSLLFSGKSADESAAVRDVSSFQNLTVYLSGTGTTSGGVITIEESADIGATGTWSLITTVNASDVSAGAWKAIHLSPGAWSFLRVRISDAITGGGTIAATLVGN